jgi:endonuclease YncB( thermonuclease family)
MIVDPKRKKTTAPLRPPPLSRPRPHARRARRPRWLRRGHWRLYIMLIGLLAYGFWSGRMEEAIVDQAFVIDGDSLRLNGVEIRIHGIDAPEMRQFCQRGGLDYRCGVEAREAMIDLTQGHSVECTVLEDDRYGRKVSRCLADGFDLGLEMVRAGHAVAYGAYETEEAAARRAGLGIWAGEFIQPQEWRATNMQERDVRDE